MRVPFVDLSAQYLAQKESYDKALSKVVAKTAFIGGATVKEFEESYSKKYGIRHCVSCGNGTDAIYIALRMLGIGAGDEVVTTATSWISTSEAISQTGAKPVFVDVDDYYLIGVDLIERAITPRTKAVIPVHLYGQSAQMSRIVELAKAYKLRIVEDCAQAHFADWCGQRVGTFGDVATFSFYPGKNLGAWGDAGAIITNDDDLATRCRMYANHGALVKHQHEMEGINSRMDALQAAILTAKLHYIDEWTTARRRIASIYDASLRGVGDLIVPKIRHDATHVYHLYVVNTAYRDDLKSFLIEREIEVAVHYPTALPLLPAYRYLGLSPDSFPRAAENQKRILSLPIYPEMSLEKIDYVVQTIRQFFESR